MSIAELRQQRFSQFGANGADAKPSMIAKLACVPQSLPLLF
jgi:hypothetical protein